MGGPADADKTELRTDLLRLKRPEMPKIRTMNMPSRQQSGLFTLSHERLKLLDVVR